MSDLICTTCDYAFPGHAGWCPKHLTPAEAQKRVELGEKLAFAVAKYFDVEIAVEGQQTITNNHVQNALNEVERRMEESHSESYEHSPTWSCSRWGEHEHDWLECPDCVKEYEREYEEVVSDVEANS